MAKILLVEDDNNLREIYEARLQAEGYDIVSARDGEEALVVAKAEKPDLVIADVMMPKISGFEMLDILRNTEGLKHVKVVMLTALGQSDDQQRANKLGADRYLVKSQVTLEDIVKAAHDLLEDGGGPAAPSPAPASAPAADDQSATTTAAKDDQVMDDAVNSLVNGAETKATKTDVTNSPDQTPTVSKKVIEPVEAPGKDIHALLAEEEAKETGETGETGGNQPAGTPDSAVPSANPDMSAAPTTASEEAAVDAKIENFVAGASSDATAPPAQPPAQPAPPDKPQDKPQDNPPKDKPKDNPPKDKPKDKPASDPNIIAL